MPTFLQSHQPVHTPKLIDVKLLRIADLDLHSVFMGVGVNDLDRRAGLGHLHTCKNPVSDAIILEPVVLGVIEERITGVATDAHICPGAKDVKQNSSTSSRENRNPGLV
jgi:hypothetical protein